MEAGDCWEVWGGRRDWSLGGSRRGMESAFGRLLEKLGDF